MFIKKLLNLSLDVSQKKKKKSSGALFQNDGNNIPIWCGERVQWLVHHFPDAGIQTYVFKFSFLISSYTEVKKKTTSKNYL
jgi:hypothetical protein